MPDLVALMVASTDFSITRHHYRLHSMHTQHVVVIVGVNGGTRHDGHVK